MRKDKCEARARTAAQERSRKRAPAAAGKERGSATVLATGVTAALLAAAVAFTALGQASAARHRAQGAADAGALAGAARVLFGEGEACAAAQAMVERSEAEFRACEVSGLEVTVHVEENPNGLPGAFGPARAVSRAGPVAVE
ncbi:Rv3654c family TadE-like protein [Glycomyces sp. NPDC049804]|uniref:Rv3654c family TadE-like protein n=1 Tax=Glycomyces sp. NPDC049804 TaxID=3154363 RepID=UPI003440D49C